MKELCVIMPLLKSTDGLQGQSIPASSRVKDD